jgi:transposase
LRGIDIVILTYYHAPDVSEGSDCMRGSDDQTSGMFSYLSPEERVRQDHPLRAIRRMTDEVLAILSPRFTAMYSEIGRPSIPPEQLLRALLIQSLYTVRSERLLMEEIDYSVLYRWFVGLSMDDPIWSPTTFSKNRDRLLESDIAAAFFDGVLAQARAAGLLSDEHFTVDGTLLDAWASLKSFRRKDEEPTPPPDDPGNPTVNFHGESRRNDTHQSTTDPDAQLARKGQGKEAKLSYAGHVLLDNRHGLVANVCATAAAGTAERDAAHVLLNASAPPGSTVGGDKGFDVPSFVAGVRMLGITPHVAQKITGSAVDGRTTRHAGYLVSQQKRKLIEQVFGWMKTVGGLRKLRHRGGVLVDWIVTFTAAAYNLIRLRTLLARST